MILEPGLSVANVIYKVQNNVTNFLQRGGTIYFGKSILFLQKFAYKSYTLLTYEVNHTETVKKFRPRSSMANHNHLITIIFHNYNIGKNCD